MPVIAYGADWSARPIDGDTLKNFTVTGPDRSEHRIALTLRYADFPGQGLSYLTAAEYESHLSAGIRSYLIYQRTTRDPDGGETRGREYGRAAVAYAQKIGYRKGDPIFFTADSPIGSYDLDVVEAFFRGAAAEVRAAGFLAGGYGFRDVIYRLQDRGVVDVYWLCGAESGWRPGIHLYQWNNGRIYPAGVEADLVKQYEPIPIPDEEEAEMSWKTLIRNHYGSDVPADDMLAYIDEHLNDVRAEQAAQRAILAEIAADPDVTPERLEQVVMAAVQSANTAHLAEVTAVVRDIVGARDEDLAQEVVDEIGRRTARTTSTPHDPSKDGI